MSSVRAICSRPGPGADLVVNATGRGSPLRYFKTSPEIIRLAVMLYVRFPLSLRNGEDLPVSAAATSTSSTRRSVTGETGSTRPRGQCCDAAGDLFELVPALHSYSAEKEVFFKQFFYPVELN